MADDLRSGKRALVDRVSPARRIADVARGSVDDDREMGFRKMADLRFAGWSIGAPCCPEKEQWSYSERPRPGWR